MNSNKRLKSEFLSKKWKVCAYHSTQGKKYGVSEDADYIEGLLCSDVVSKDVAEAIAKVPEMIEILQEVLENCIPTDDYSCATLCRVMNFLESLERK